MNIRPKRIIGVIILVIVTLCNIIAQPSNSIPQFEKEINNLFAQISKLSAFDKDSAAERLLNLIDTSIQLNGSFDYPFDSIKKIGKIYSPDRQLRIYSWNIPIGVDKNLYYSIIHYISKQDKKYKTIKMRGTGKQYDSLTVENWPGALYYEIAETKHAGEKYYTLLGFDFGNLLTNKKVIDVVTIDKFNEFRFCRSLIKYDGKMTDRIVFEFSEKVSMMLKYNQKLDMIVFDHLSPEKPSLEGNFQYYGPDFSYDGLKFDKGIWVHQKNIVITN